MSLTESEITEKSSLTDIYFALMMKLIIISNTTEDKSSYEKHDIMHNCHVNIGLRITR